MRKLNIAIIHTRLNCLDGVSIEAEKLGKAYESLNCNIFQIAGKICKKSRIKSLEISEANHLNPKIIKLNEEAYSRKLSDKQRKKIIKRIYYYSDMIKPKLKNFIIKNKINLLSVENIFSLPVNISLTIAVFDIINELNLPCIARHHDFYWDMGKYLRCEANFKDIFNRFFLPKHTNIINVVINKAARDSLKKNKGMNSIVVYNKFNFRDVDKINKYYLRKRFQIRNDEIIFLQPTKILGRKKIERSIELVSLFKKRFGKRCVLVITGPTDHDERYRQKLIKIAKKLNVKIISTYEYTTVNKKSTDSFNILPKGFMYPPADIITLPSDYEGFGNPVIESAMYKKPLVVNKYPILNEILDFGFKFIVMNKKVTSKILNEVHRAIVDRDHTKKITEHNFKIAYKYFSLNLLKKELKLLIKKAIKIRNNSIQ